jgi:hypothetical protein
MLENGGRNPYVICRNGCTRRLKIIEYGSIKISGLIVDVVNDDPRRIQEYLTLPCSCFHDCHL